MTERQIVELAAILVNEYGHAAPRIAECRRDQHADRPHSDSYRVWARIAEAATRLIQAGRNRQMTADCS